jgi:adenylate kinase
VGPPGSDVRTLTLQLSTHFEATVVSVGDLLNKEVSKKTDTGQKIEEYIKETLYVPDDLVVKVLKAHLSTLDKSQNFIIEGFPKTLYQSMAIVKEKIIPDLFIVVNYPEEQFKNFAKKKFSGQGRDQWQEFSESERTERGRDYLSQYQLYL